MSKKQLKQRFIEKMFLLGLVTYDTYLRTSNQLRIDDILIPWPF